jgi:hypothetical protein
VVNEVARGQKVSRNDVPQEEVEKIKATALILATQAADEIDASNNIVDTLRRFSGDGPMKWGLYKMVRGQLIHNRFSELINEQGIPEFRGEGPSYFLKDIASWGHALSSRPDATYGPRRNPFIAFELKTGFTPPSALEMYKYDNNLPSGTEFFLIQQIKGD